MDGARALLTGRLQASCAAQAAPGGRAKSQMIPRTLGFGDALALARGTFPIEQPRWKRNLCVHLFLERSAHSSRASTKSRCHTSGPASARRLHRHRPVIILNRGELRVTALFSPASRLPLHRVPAGELRANQLDARRRGALRRSKGSSTALPSLTPCTRSLARHKDRRPRPMISSSATPSHELENHGDAGGNTAGVGSPPLLLESAHTL